MTPLRLIFMGTPDFAVPCLEALVAAGHEMVAVYCQPPRPAGRGRKPRPSPVQHCAARLGLPVYTPKTLKSTEDQETFAALRADAVVVVAYGLILPQPVLDAPRLGCFNLHASLLPRWRGAAPIQRAVMAGDTETGVAVMRMEAGLDTGPVVLEERVAIGANTTAGILHDQLAARGAPLMVRALEGVAAGTLVAKPQSSQGATYAEKIEPAEGRLDWPLPAVELDRRIRGLSPWPGAWFEHQGRRIKVRSAVPLDDVSGTPGTLLDDQFTVACGRGALRLTELQRPGKAFMPADAFLRGFPLPKGTVLG